jgi:hypothetical protein
MSEAQVTEHGWPGEPGVPVNPDVEGPHWLSGEVFIWRGDQWWSVEPGCEGYITKSLACSKFYGGPCLTPAEVAEEVSKEREACAALCAERAKMKALDGDEFAHGMQSAYELAARAIRARTAQQVADEAREERG